MRNTNTRTGTLHARFPCFPASLATPSLPLSRSPASPLSPPLPRLSLSLASFRLSGSPATLPLPLLQIPRFRSPLPLLPPSPLAWNKYEWAWSLTLRMLATFFHREKTIYPVNWWLVFIVFYFQIHSFIWSYCACFMCLLQVVPRNVNYLIILDRNLEFVSHISWISNHLRLKKADIKVGQIKRVL